MTGLTSSPKVRKAALVVMDLVDPASTAIVFQYNPENVTRTLQPQNTPEGAGDAADFARVRGAPIETVRLEVEIDATDDLADGDGITQQVGIYPQLAQLELLLYPKSTQVALNTGLVMAGSLEILPPAAPLTFLVWGLKRVVPVRLTEFSVTEEAHDPSLNPIRAKVSLTLRVLSYNDLPSGGPGYYAFIAHQVAKEGLAAMRGVISASSVISGGVRLI
jgi:hypothetical protein